MPDLNSLWKKIITSLLDEISYPNIITWFRCTKILSMENKKLIIGLPRNIFLTWHQKNSKKKIKKIIQGFHPYIEEVIFQIDGSLENSNKTFDILEIIPSKKTKVRKLPKIAEVKIAGSILSKQLNKKFQLNNFITGSENRLAHAASEAVSKEPGKKYNPLFIYGGVGLGKTHLLHAIGNEILKSKNMLVALVNAENFMAEFIDNIRKGKIEKMRDKWRRADVLIVDDIQFLAGKERTEEFFFHLFNDLFDANKQIVVSSDKPPSRLKQMEKRLISRFSMGIIVDISFPSLETRIAILQQKAQENGVVLDLEIMEFIAKNVHHSVRELEGVLNQIIAKIDLENELPTKKSVTDIITRVNRDLRIETQHPETMTDSSKTINEIVDKISDYFSVTKTEIIGSNRSKEFLIPRQIAMWFCKKKLKEPLKKIGIFFGGRDHSSVINSIKKIERLRKTDREFYRTINGLRKEMGF